MQQLSIQFFWPLTEQIPLELDYTDCERPKLTIPNEVSSGLTLMTNGGTWQTTTISNSLRIGPDETNGYFKLGNLEIAQDKPNFLQRMIYKLLGFDWKQK